MTDHQFVAAPSSLRWVAPPALFDPQRPDWQKQGECVGLNPDIFFPAKGDDFKSAKAVCAACAVRAECLEYALATEQRFGVWGGTSERERRKLRAGRKKAS